MHIQRNDTVRTLVCEVFDWHVQNKENVTGEDIIRRVDTVPTGAGYVGRVFFHVEPGSSSSP